MRKAKKEELVAVDGIGDVLADAWIDFFSSEKNNEIVDHLLDELTIEETAEEEEAEGVFDGISFVITGSVEHFKNRKEIQEIIEQKGGKVTGSVTAKTNYLINNDTASSSSKIKRRRNLEFRSFRNRNLLRWQILQWSRNICIKRSFLILILPWAIRRPVLRTALIMPLDGLDIRRRRWKRSKRPSVFR